MDASTVAAALELHKARLEELGVERLLLVGSVARGEDTVKSDIDFVVEFRGKATFLGYMNLLELLEETMGRTVELTTLKALRPEIAADVLSKARRVA